jgi:hypothetical protein
MLIRLIKRKMALTVLLLMPFFFVNNCSSSDLEDKKTPQCISRLIIESGKLESFKVPCSDKIRLTEIINKTKDEIDIILGNPFSFKTKIYMNSIFYKEGSISVVYDSDNISTVIKILPSNLNASINDISEFLGLNNNQIETPNSIFQVLPNAPIIFDINLIGNNKISCTAAKKMDNNIIIDNIICNKL